MVWVVAAAAAARSTGRDAAGRCRTAATTARATPAANMIAISRNARADDYAAAVLRKGDERTRADEQQQPTDEDSLRPNPSPSAPEVTTNARAIAKLAASS